MRLSEKTCVVTGGASGIGEAIVRRFADEGALVLIADLNEAAAEALADELGDSVIAMRCDVRSTEDAAARLRPPSMRGAASTYWSITPVRS